MRLNGLSAVGAFYRGASRRAVIDFPAGSHAKVIGFTRQLIHVISFYKKGVTIVTKLGALKVVLPWLSEHWSVV